MKNSTWFITGVSSGFGYEMTKQLLEKGKKVIGTVRNKKRWQTSWRSILTPSLARFWM